MYIPLCSLKVHGDVGVPRLHSLLGLLRTNACMDLAGALVARARALAGN